jgi:hypothetical protein
MLASWFSDPMTAERWLLVIVGLPIALIAEAWAIIGYKSRRIG